MKKVISAVSLFILLVLFGAIGIYFFFDKNKFNGNEIKKPISKTVIPTVAAIDSEKPEKKTSLFVTGDVLLARTVNAKMVENNDFDWPFEKISGTLKSADILFVNLETPLVSGCPVIRGSMRFCGDRRGIKALMTAGVDVVGISNNHMGNFGYKGVEETVDVLSKNGFFVAGTSEIPIVSKNGKKFAFLAFNDIGLAEKGFEFATEEAIMAALDKAKKMADFTIVMFHWGVEYTHKPTERQRKLAHFAVENGADLVVGNHPHWVQGIENFQGKWIVYSHGNFVFDQEWSEETTRGVIGQYTFGPYGVEGLSFLPIKIENYGQPRIATGNEADLILGNMKEIDK